jgi:hypothetical protein
MVSVPCHKNVIDHSCPSLIPRWLQERMAQNKGQKVQNGVGDAKNFLFLVNSWAQVKKQCFLAKTV